jgi:uncharacterized membrane-anchored protein YjiN (DUF445 family)
VEALAGLRYQLEALVASVAGAWSADEIARRIEIEIGRDLQYIRINGTLVGGAAGPLLHAAIVALFG